MRISPNDACPLGAHLQHYWDRLSDKEKKMELDGGRLLNLTFSVSGTVVMRLPKNFELSELDSIGRDYGWRKICRTGGSFTTAYTLSDTRLL